MCSEVSHQPVWYIHCSNYSYTNMFNISASRLHLRNGTLLIGFIALMYTLYCQTISTYDARGLAHTGVYSKQRLMTATSQGDRDLQGRCPELLILKF